MPPCTTTFGFYAAKRRAAKNPVMKARSLERRDPAD
jgi:hypothetical protein